MGRMFDALQKVEREKNRWLNEEDFSEDTPRSIVLDSKLVSFFDPSSIAAEQFRKLRTYIIRPGLDHSPRTVLVTSAMEGEGKSLTAINLAITVATELHSHALLVDCDLRNPALSRMFGFQNAKGLSSYLVGEAELPELLIKTEVDKLSVLPSGPFQDNPTELIGSNKMKSLIADLKTRYADRYIILDSTPLLATTESSILTEMVDGMIFVIKSGVTPRESVQQALKLLDKKKILGAVLNSLEFKTEALRRRYFGTNTGYGYHDRLYKTYPEPGIWRKVLSLIGDVKMFVTKTRSAKKNPRTGRLTDGEQGNSR